MVVGGRADKFGPIRPRKVRAQHFVIVAGNRGAGAAFDKRRCLFSVGLLGIRCDRPAIVECQGGIVRIRDLQEEAVSPGGDLYGLLYKTSVSSVPLIWVLQPIVPL